MNDACIIAVGAVSALGVGRCAFETAHEGEPARVALALDPALEAAGLARPFAGRAPADLGVSTGDRAIDLLIAALAPVLADLDATRPDWRSSRLGLAIGTSSGGMLTSERFFKARAEGALSAEIARGATYFAPLDAALAHVGLARPAHTTQILAACAASTIAIGIALRWLDRGACDLVLAGGYDGVSTFVASGFEALRATTASRPRPFRIGRDGMSLGEGAGIVALVREKDARANKVLGRVAGFGASTDAVHITAPDRTGGGLARAGSAAIADAGIEPALVGLVSAHATATPFNDAMESKAIAATLGEGAAPVVHPFKAQIGHTLGAAGVLEMLAAADALARGAAPAASGEGDLDPEAPAVLLARGERRELAAALKLSAAFGGTNAALVITRSPSARRRRAIRPVRIASSARVEAADLEEVSRATGIPRDRLGRLDLLARLGLAAVTKLATTAGADALAGAGIVAGHALATLETNDAFDARKRARGARFVEPRAFPGTSPNAIAGECAIAWKLTGPGFSVGAGLDGGTEALLAAAEIVACGDAEKMVVVVADEAGAASLELLRTAGIDRRYERGAIALLLEAGAGARSIDLDWSKVAHDDASSPIGHVALRLPE